MTFDYRESKAGKRRFKYTRFYRFTVLLQTILWKCGIAEFIALLRNSLPALLAERQALREALEGVKKVRDAMAVDGKDFFITGSQRAYPLLCNAVDALSLADKPL